MLLLMSAFNINATSTQWAALYHQRQNIIESKAPKTYLYRQYHMVLSKAVLLWLLTRQTRTEHGAHGNCPATQPHIAWCL